MACPQDKPFPSILVDEQTLVSSEKCSIADWMLNEPFLQTRDGRDVYSKLETWVQHWGEKTKTKNAVKLWRWLTPVTRSDLIEYESAKNSSDQEMREKLAEEASKEVPAVNLRLHFVEHMLMSPIFFPFFTEDQLRELALTQEHIGKALISLDWSRRGHVRILLCPSIRTPATWVTEPVQNIVPDLTRHPSAAVRLFVFNNFHGVMCAYNNSLFTGKQIKPKWLAVSHVLAPEEKKIVDQIFATLRIVGAPDPAQLQTLKSMRNVALGLQATGLSPEDMVWFDKIMNIEIFLDGKPLTPTVKQELSKMYEAKRREKTLEEAEQFQILALCNAGQYIEHLRSKFKAMYPHLAVSDIAQLSKKTICQTLLHDSKVSQLNFSTSILDLVDVPKHLINEKSGLLNAKQEIQRGEIEQFLMSRYGITRSDFIEQNSEHLRKIEDDPAPYKTFSKTKSESDQKNSRVKSNLHGRLALAKDDYCRVAKSPAPLGDTAMCSEDASGDYTESAATMKDVLRGLFSSYCSPTMPLFRSDVLFIRDVYTIFSFFRQASRRAPVPLSRLDQMCLFNKAELEVLFDTLSDGVAAFLQAPFRQGWSELIYKLSSQNLQSAQRGSVEIVENPDMASINGIILGLPFSSQTSLYTLMFVLGKASEFGIAKK